LNFEFFKDFQVEYVTHIVTGTSSQLLFVLSPSLHFLLLNSLVFVLLVCFILVPHRL